VGVVRTTLQDPRPCQHSIFDFAVEFYFYLQYDSHDDAMLDLMGDSLRRFHHSKNVFQQFRAANRLAAEAKER
jgi:hypothetical protein